MEKTRYNVALWFVILLSRSEWNILKQRKKLRKFFQRPNFPTATRTGEFTKLTTNLWTTFAYFPSLLSSGGHVQILKRYCWFHSGSNCVIEIVDMAIHFRHVNHPKQRVSCSTVFSWQKRLKLTFQLSAVNQIVCSLYMYFADFTRIYLLFSRFPQ